MTHDFWNGILAAHAHALNTPSRMTKPVMPEQLGRFGHHPDSAIDFCIEVDELIAIATSARMGLTGMGHEDDREGYAARYRAAMEFVVGGDQGAIEAKAVLRDLPENVL